MASPADVLRDFFVTQGVLVWTDPTPTPTQWATTTFNMPPDLDNVVVFGDTGGVLDGKIQRTGEDVLHPTVQIRLRSREYHEGWAKGQELQLYCRRIGVPTDREIDPVKYPGVMGLGKVTQVSDDVTYRLDGVHLRSSLIPMGVEEQHQTVHFSINVMLALVNLGPVVMTEAILDEAGDELWDESGVALLEG